MFPGHSYRHSIECNTTANPGRAFVFRTSLDRNFPVLVVKNVNISLFLIKLHI
jgi:hypothetical protein